MTEREIERWPVGRPFGLRERTQEITLQVIMRAVFGIRDLERLGSSTSGSAHARHRHRSARDGRDRIPALRRTIAKGKWDKFMRLREEADELIYDEIARRRDDPSTTSATTCSRSFSRPATRTGAR